MLSCLLLLLSFIKQPLGLPIFLNALSILWGALATLYIKKIPKIYIWFFLFITTGVIGNVLYSLDFVSGLRTLQVLLLLFFSIYICQHLHHFSRKFIYLVIFVFSCSFLLEIIFNVRYAREAFGFVLPRLAGLHGDPNYNSVLIVALAIFSVYIFKRISLFTVALLVLSTLGFSRGAFLGATVFLLVYFFYNKFPFLTYIFSIFLFFVLFLQPLFLYLTFLYLDKDLLVTINALSSDRLAHWKAYLDIALAHPLGAGFFVGQTIEANYLDLNLFPHVKPQQAHSMYFSSLADFGIIGYLFLSIAFFESLRTVKNSRIGIAIILFILVSFFSLNFLGEISFWLMISIIAGLAKSEGVKND